jgi:hypothetical protein
MTIRVISIVPGMDMTTWQIESLPDLPFVPEWAGEHPGRLNIFDDLRNKQIINSTNRIQLLGKLL